MKDKEKYKKKQESRAQERTAFGVGGRRASHQGEEGEDAGREWEEEGGRGSGRREGEREREGMVLTRPKRKAPREHKSSNWQAEQGSNADFHFVCTCVTRKHTCLLDFLVRVPKRVERGHAVNNAKKNCSELRFELFKEASNNTGTDKTADAMR